MKKKVIIFSLTLFLVVSIITLLNCEKNKENQISAKKEKKNSDRIDDQNVKKPVKLSVRMKWFFAGTMSGWFAAKEYGFFKKHGLDVTINPGSPQNSSVKLVSAKSDDFGVTGADELLLARSKNMPVVAIAVLFKHSPICFVSKRNKGIKSPKDWIGKTVEVSYGENAEYQYRALLQKFDIKESDVKEVPYTFNLIPFLENNVDVSPAYIMDQAVVLELKGVELNKIFAKDYGIDPYGDIIITREEIIKNRPEVVKRFLMAVIEAHSWAINNIDKSVDALIRNAKYLKNEEQIIVFKKTLPFLIPEDDSLPIGKMALKRWEESQNLLLKFKVLKIELDLSSVFTNNYLPYSK